MRVSLSDSILATLIFYSRQSDGYKPREPTRYELRYYKDVSTPVKFCSEAYFFMLGVFNEPEISDSGSPA